ncbi:MAG: Crp/Fnr family transcriptional regulator [Bacteroidales bacterium]
MNKQRIYPEKDIQKNLKDELIPFQETLSEEEFRKIHENSNIVTYNKQDVIFKQNTRTSHTMFVKKGLIKVYRENRNNKTKIIKINTPGQYLGLNSIFGEDTFSYSAEAIEKSEVLMIDSVIFEEILQENGIFTYNLMRYLSKDNLILFQQMISQSQKQLPGRIADIILYFTENIFNSKNFTFPLNRTELAEMAGTTKESLIRTLTEFKNDKIIQLEGKKVKIISYDILKTLSRIG